MSYRILMGKLQNHSTSTQSTFLDPAHLVWGCEDVNIEVGEVSVCQQFDLFAGRGTSGELGCLVSQDVIVCLYTRINLQLRTKHAMYVFIYGKTTPFTHYTQDKIILKATFLCVYFLYLSLERETMHIKIMNVIIVHV